MAETAAERARGGDCLEALPEEVLLEVFSHVSNVKDLFLLAVTCRWWLQRFTDPVFLRGLCQGHRVRLLGFFFQETRFVRCEENMNARMAQRSSAFVPTFLPAPGLSSAGSTLTFFIADDDGIFNYAEPLATRRGVVLMRLVPRSLDDIPTRMRPTSLFPDSLRITMGMEHGVLLGICNPITGERHVLPALVTGRGGHVFGYAIVIAADDSDFDGEQRRPSSFSQLLVISRLPGDDKDIHLYLRSYSATTRSWSAPTMCLPVSRFSLEGERSAVVHQGAAHWLCLDHKGHNQNPRGNNLYKLSTELGTTRVSLTNLSINVGRNPFLGVGRDGKLSITSVHPLHATLWTQQDGDECDDAPPAWVRTQVMRIPAAELDPARGVLFEREWFSFNKGSMLALYEGGGIFVLDLEKRTMERVMDFSPLLFSRIRNAPGPYEIDLVDFFVYQLGGICRRIIT